MGNAVVVGGGIGGLAAARGLVDAGWDVTVHERLADPTAQGSGISVWPNALRALDTLGLGEAVRDLGRVQAAGGVRDRRGRWLARTTTAALEARHGDGIVVLARADLLRTLRDALPPGVLRTGSAPEPAALHDDPAVDLLVGADGIGSATRPLVDPGARLRATGTVAWRLVAAVDDPPDEGGETWGDGCYAGVAPLRDGTCHLWAVVRDDEPAARDLDALRDRFAGWHPPIPALLARADPGSAFVTDLSWLVPLRRLARDRTVLLGDAAHAMTPNLGQGACLALEDAATLARVLRAGRPDEALARYDALRRPRTSRLTRLARAAGLVAGMHGRVPTTLRDALGRATPDALALRALDVVLGASGS